MSSSGARLILLFLTPVVMSLGVTACTQSASPPPQTQGLTAKTSSRESAPHPSAPTGSATATAPASSPASSPTSSPTAASATRATILAMADGRYAARITAVDSRRQLVTVDVVQLFLGKAAATAAAQDHAERVPPPNDVWMRNQSHLLRTLSVTNAAPITVNDLGAIITHSSVTNLRVTLARLGQFPNLDDGTFWLTVRHGVVTQIAEQYLP